MANGVAAATSHVAVRHHHQHDPLLTPHRIEVDRAKAIGDGVTWTEEEAMVIEEGATTTGGYLVVLLEITRPWLDARLTVWRADGSAPETVLLEAVAEE